MVDDIRAEEQQPGVGGMLFAIVSSIRAVLAGWRAPSRESDFERASEDHAAQAVAKAIADGRKDANV